MEGNKPILVTHQLNSGRTGNQLWQIAATLSMAKRLNGIAVFPKNEIFNGFKGPFEFRDDLRDIITHNYHEPYFHYTAFDEGECVKIRDNEQVVINLNGYFQSPKYWYWNFNSAFSKLEFVNNLIWPDRPAVSLHLRFGDYVNNSYYTDLIKDGYYERALTYILQKYSEEFPRFLVFSDDKKLASEYCEVLFANKLIDWRVISQNSEIEDLNLMSGCDSSIIANSSFSYWGAVLGKDKTILAPKNWFGPSANIDTKDMYYHKMILL